MIEGMMLPTGLYADPGSGGLGSAEAVALSEMPLDVSEVQRVLHRGKDFITVLTCCGKSLVLRAEEAEKLGL